LWFAAACAPSLFLVVRHAAETVVAERYVYLPSVAFALAAGGAAAHLTQGRFKKPLFAVLGGLLAVYAVTSWRATALWQDDLSLWSGLVRQTVPARHALPWVNLGVSQMAAKNLDEAERAFLHAQDPGVISDVENQALVASGLGSVAVSRGMAAFASGRQDEALRLFTHAEYYFTQAVSSGLPDWTFAKNLGQTRIYRAIVDRVRTGRYDRGLLLSARQDLLLALRLSPGNAEIQSLLDSCESYLSSSP
jgi:tetratricopeptide (TPR) repeat protein